jgi:hypothetical protein
MAVGPAFSLNSLDCHGSKQNTVQNQPDGASRRLAPRQTLRKPDASALRLWKDEGYWALNRADRPELSRHRNKRPGRLDAIA